MQKLACSLVALSYPELKDGQAFRQVDCNMQSPHRNGDPYFVGKKLILRKTAPSFGNLLDDVTDHLHGAGIQAGAAGPAGSPGAGRELFDRIYGDGADGVRDHLRSLDSDLADLVAGHAYGSVLSRDGLDARDRELLAVVMLAATGHDRQLASHARGAIRCGAEPQEVTAALDAVEDLVPSARMQRARDVTARFTRAD